MKKNLWLILTAVISTSLFAQDASNTPPPAIQAPPPATAPATPTPAVEPPPAVEASTNAPAKKPKAKKKTAKKTTTHKPVLKTVPLVAGPAVVDASHVNVRSKAGLVGEVFDHLTNGEPVTVIEEVQLKHSGPEEPSAWAKIAMPSDAHVWVKSSYIDTNNTVTASKLKLHAGPGENYGVVGIINKGDQVQPTETKGDWTQVAAPTNAYAFVASEFLKQGEEVAMAAPTTPTPETPLATNTVTEAPPVTPATNEIAAATTTDTNATATTTTDTNTPAPVVEEKVPRIIQHEGIVRYSLSVQAPTTFQLVNPDNHTIINYLYTTNLDLNRYKGMDIIVTGEEGLDERWKNTPVLTIQDIKVIQ